MNRCTDRFARPCERRIQVGERARLPLCLGARGAELYRHPWDVIAWAGEGLRHCIIIRRAADGLTKTLAAHWWARYTQGDE